MRKEELMKHKKLSKRALALTLASAMVLGLTPVPALPFTTVQVAEAAVVTPEEKITENTAGYADLEVADIKGLAEGLADGYDETIGKQAWVDKITNKDVKGAVKGSLSQIDDLIDEFEEDGITKEEAVNIYNQIVDVYNNYVSNDDVKAENVDALLKAYIENNTGVADITDYSAANEEALAEAYAATENIEEELLYSVSVTYLKALYAILPKDESVVTVTKADYEKNVGLAKGYIDNIETIATRTVNLAKFQEDAVKKLEDYAENKTSSTAYDEAAILEIGGIVSDYTDDINAAETIKAIGDGEYDDELVDEETGADGNALLAKAYKEIDGVLSLEDAIEDAKKEATNNLGNIYNTKVGVATVEEVVYNYAKIASIPSFDWDSNKVKDNVYSKTNAKLIFEALKEAIGKVDDIASDDIDYAKKISTILSDANIAVAKINTKAKDAQLALNAKTLAQSKALSNIQAHAEKIKAENTYLPTELDTIDTIVNDSVEEVTDAETKEEVDELEKGVIASLNALLTRDDFQKAADDLKDLVDDQKDVAFNYYTSEKDAYIKDKEYGPNGQKKIEEITAACKLAIDDFDKELKEEGYTFNIFDKIIENVEDRNKDGLAEAVEEKYAEMINDTMDFEFDLKGKISGPKAIATNIAAKHLNGVKEGDEVKIWGIKLVPLKDAELGAEAADEGVINKAKEDAQTELNIYAAKKIGGKVGEVTYNGKGTYSEESVNEIRAILAKAIRDISDPDLKSTTTITNIKIQAEADMDAVKTSSQGLVEDETLADKTAELQAIINDAKKYKKSVYSDAGIKQIDEIIAGSEAVLNDENRTIDQVEAEIAKYEYKDGVDYAICKDVPTSLDENLAQRKATTRSDIEKIVTDAKLDEYDKTANTAVNNAVKTANEDVDKVTTEAYGLNDKIFDKIKATLNDAIAAACTDEHKLSVQKEQEDNAKATDVINAIKGLYDAIEAAKATAGPNADDQNKAALETIAKVQEAYDKLTDDQKAIVDADNTYNSATIKKYNDDYTKVVLQRLRNDGKAELEQIRADIKLEQYNEDKYDALNKAVDGGLALIEKAESLDDINAAIAQAKADLAAVPDKAADAVAAAEQEVKKMKEEAQKAQDAADKAADAAKKAQDAADAKEASLNQTIADEKTKAQAEANSKAADLIAAQTTKATEAQAAADAAKAEAAKAAEAQKAAEAKLAAAQTAAAQTTTQAAAQTTVGKASIKKLTNKKGKKLVVAIDPVDGATGYEVSIATKKNFKSNFKMATTTKASSTFKKLKKKTYYVRVRAYKTTADGSVYGNYSDVKKIKIKK